MNKEYQAKIDECVRLGNELFDLGAEKRNAEIEALEDGKLKDELLKKKAQSEKNRKLFNFAINAIEPSMILAKALSENKTKEELMESKPLPKDLEYYDKLFCIPMTPEDYKTITDKPYND